MKLPTLALLASTASSLTTNDTNDWVPTPCEYSNDCLNPETMDALKLEFSEDGKTGSPENIICADYYFGADKESAQSKDVCMYDFACGSEGVDGDGTWWYIDCYDKEDGAKKLAAAGAAALMLALTM